MSILEGHSVFEEGHNFCFGVFKVIHYRGLFLELQMQCKIRKKNFMSIVEMAKREKGRGKGEGIPNNLPSPFRGGLGRMP